jgi:hypothetical protein
MYNKTSRIVKCTFTNEWQNQTGAMIYYHELVLENGDTGSCGAMEKMPTKLSPNSPIHYTIDNKKIKIISNSSESSNNNYQKPMATKTSSKTYGPKKKDEFLGYAWSYAKDLLIAGKTMDDVEELNKIARYIYSEIGKMLNENDNNTLF